jgi:hypothetical protein
MTCCVEIFFLQLVIFQKVYSNYILTRERKNMKIQTVRTVNTLFEPMIYLRIAIKNKIWVVGSGHSGSNDIGLNYISCPVNPLYSVSDTQTE